MCIVGDDPVACSHVADHISLRIDHDFVKIELLHLCGDGVNVSLLIAALARILYDGAQECGHVFFIVLCSFFDLIQVHSYSFSFS